MRHFVSIMKLGNHYNNIVESKKLRGCYGVADATSYEEYCYAQFICLPPTRSQNSLFVLYFELY